MKGVPAGLVVSVLCSAPLLAQEQDRSLERIGLALQQPPPTVSGNPLLEGRSQAPKTLGIFTLVPPTLRGEMVRVSVPIGELVTRAFKGVAATNQRRRESAARRKVEAALEWFAEQQPHPKQ